MSPSIKTVQYTFRWALTVATLSQAGRVARPGKTGWVRAVQGKGAGENTQPRERAGGAHCAEASAGPARSFILSRWSGSSFRVRDRAWSGRRSHVWGQSGTAVQRCCLVTVQSPVAGVGASRCPRSPGFMLPSGNSACPAWLTGLLSPSSGIKCENPSERRGQVEPLKRRHSRDFQGAAILQSEQNQADTREDAVSCRRQISSERQTLKTS